MTTTTKRVALATTLPGGSTPPTEFLIWAFGSVKTTKGNFFFDDESAESVMQSYAEYGNRLTIDYEHKAVDPNRRAGDGKAAGSFALELRDNGLYAVDVRWTPPAAEALTNKEWLYFSPYFSAEEDSGRILELVNLALTNIPATMNMQPLVAAGRSFLDMADTNETMDVAASGGGDDDDDAADDKAKKAAKKTARDRLAKAKAELDAAAAECASFGEDDDDDSEDEDDDDGDGGGGDEDDEKKKAAAALPVAASKRRAGRTAASHIEAAARALTGKSDEGEIIGALTALGNATRVNVSLSKRVTDLERKLRKSDVESMVVRAIKTGKLTPAEREWALSYGMESPAKLRGYLDVTPARATVAGTELREPQRPGTPNGGPTLAVALSSEERRICENTGIDPEKFAAVRHRPVRVG